ncbi:LaaC protein [Bacillus cereus VDM021]|uniref:YdeI/OmpD-associated family protein n=1 Tax=Bacillus cereus group TaxID=86661 RepID=UPI00032E0E86|nr:MULTISPECIES: YdeI/OmpD-associated family protein [Bacillus cereus group]EOP54239.1 LaaC protein [Bacillus cereus VD136]EOP73466.1 LaaC protein [Bacillus cereus VDM006]EOQ08398.1 LaaC protein [Bacillus cereus VDM021]MDF2085471.1 YdeI/OmpD-associated family protein [Bacillus pseudomycoides]
MSVIDKLNLSKYSNMVVINQPNDYALFTEQAIKLSKNHDAIFIFVETIDEMVKHTQLILNKQLLLEKGYLFFAYPKKGNNRYETFIHRDEIFPAMNVGEDGYVDNSDIKFARMVSMDDVFTIVGLKREKKKVKKTSTASQCVSDYVENIKDVEALLANHPNELQFYQGLTPGYQKDWARHIFSAKQQQTREKRAQQMVEILSQGYKSIDLFRRKKK